mmetsp:Transcript_59851/g.143814  ORF Transcript_59851/g.143814 Transcript_59851/m.143814 type:complete len:213 (-) Transcript_59851:234-872(-)
MHPRVRRRPHRRRARDRRRARQWSAVAVAVACRPRGRPRGRLQGCLCGCLRRHEGCQRRVRGGERGKHRHALCAPQQRRRVDQPVAGRPPVAELESHVDVGQAAGPRLGVGLVAQDFGDREAARHLLRSKRLRGADLRDLRAFGGFRCLRCRRCLRGDGGRRWEHSLSTRVLSVNACTCCASARHLLVWLDGGHRLRAVVPCHRGPWGWLLR